MSNAEDREEIRQIARDFFEQIWNQGDPNAIDKFISPNTIGNDPQFGTGRESFRKKWREWQVAFPNIHFRVDEVIVEGNQVVTKWHLTGTQSGPLEGLPASNKEVSVDGVSIDQIENGQVVSGFDAWDSLNFRKQLGLPL
jgi:steroid delta-isomerase-like uncharacterized protein